MPITRLRASDGRFVSGGAGIEWRGLGLLSEMYAVAGAKMIAAQQAAADKLAEVMEQYAQTNAPWQDRTGDARASLKTVVVHDGDKSFVYLGYGSEITYAVYLENVEYGGTSYAIVRPTIEYFASQIPSYLVGNVA